jgi:hypothetical protein
MMNERRQDMNWDLSGLRVSGRYLGEFPVAGLVRNSRVKYGGSIEHAVVLDDRLDLFGRVREAGEVVLLDHREITRVQSGN